MNEPVAAAPGGPPEFATGQAAVDKTRNISPSADAPDSSTGLLDRPMFAHASGGPTAGLLDKVKELQQRFKDTPGATLMERSVTSHHTWIRTCINSTEIAMWL